MSYIIFVVFVAVAVISAAVATPKTTLDGVVDPSKYIYTHQEMGVFNLTSCR